MRNPSSSNHPEMRENVCAVTKGGADLKPSFSSSEPTILLVCARDRDHWQGPGNAQAQ